MTSPVLETCGLSKSFGALSVANAIDFHLQRGARHALIGPNGAGKTSFVNLVAGALRPTAGRILLDGADITALPQAARVKRGLVRTFQITALFRSLNEADPVEHDCVAVAGRDAIGTSTVIRSARRKIRSSWSITRTAISGGRLSQGSVLAEGSPAAVGADPRVRQVYLGERIPA
jgi:ABC-type branched-subunit amino acid transport system ATPase component